MTPAQLIKICEQTTYAHGKFKTVKEHCDAEDRFEATFSPALCLKILRDYEKLIDAVSSPLQTEMFPRCCARVGIKMKQTVRERFFSKVVKTESCWLWTSSAAPRGYGRFYYKGKSRVAGRVSWELFHEKNWPGKMYACHTCDNPPCVNPDHIFPGTQKDNIRDAKSKGRMNPPGSNKTTDYIPHNKMKTHCGDGHAL